MYLARCRIHLSDTDATGVIFFPKLLEKSLWAFEDFLESRSHSLNLFFDAGFFFPVVHVDMDFYAPLFAMEEICIEIQLTHLGNTSATLAYRFLDAALTCRAKASITHVLVSKNSRAKVVLTPEVKEVLQALSEEVSLLQ